MPRVVPWLRAGACLPRVLCGPPQLGRVQSAAHFAALAACAHLPDVTALPGHQRASRRPSEDQSASWRRLAAPAHARPLPALTLLPAALPPFQRGAPPNGPLASPPLQSPATAARPASLRGLFVPGRRRPDTPAVPASHSRYALLSSLSERPAFAPPPGVHVNAQPGGRLALAPRPHHARGGAGRRRARRAAASHGGGPGAPGPGRGGRGVGQGRHGQALQVESEGQVGRASVKGQQEKIPHCFLQHLHRHAEARFADATSFGGRDRVQDRPEGQGPKNRVSRESRVPLAKVGGSARKRPRNEQCLQTCLWLPRTLIVGKVKP